MTYVKPDLLVLVAASDAIQQSDGLKTMTEWLDSHIMRTSQAAYEADE